MLGHHSVDSRLAGREEAPLLPHFLCLFLRSLGRTASTAPQLNWFGPVARLPGPDSLPVWSSAALLLLVSPLAYVLFLLPLLGFEVGRAMVQVFIAPPPVWISTALPQAAGSSAINQQLGHANDRHVVLCCGYGCCRCWT